MIPAAIFQIADIILLIINLIFVWLNVRNAGSPSLYMTSDFSYAQLVSGSSGTYFYLGNAGPGVARSVRCSLYRSTANFGTSKNPVFRTKLYLDAVEAKSRFRIDVTPDRKGYLFKVEQKKYPLTPVWVPYFGKKIKVNYYVFDSRGNLVAPQRLGEDPCQRIEEYKKAIEDGDVNRLWEIPNSK